MMKKHRLIIELELDIQGEATEDRVNEAVKAVDVEDITVRLVSKTSRVIERAVCDYEGLLEISEMFNSMVRRGLN